MRRSLFDHLVVNLMPWVPRPIVQRVGRRYVAGETIADAVQTIRRLNAEGAMATIDILGEEIQRRDLAEHATREYGQLVETIAKESLDANISVKLTAIGLKIEESFCRDNLERIARRARERGTFVRIDMEDHTCTDATLHIYRQLQPELGNLGVVLQAMLHRTTSDVDELLQLRPSVRLCKGIYREPSEIAYVDADRVRQSFVECLNKLLEAGCYVGIATHDEVLIEAALQTIRRLRLQRDAYEFQMLLGVLPALRRRLLGEGHRLRVYVPYGADWYGYSVRRLRENPTVAKHVLMAMLRRE